MLMILHPELKPLIKELPGGLMPVRISDQEKLSLVVKIQKEAILAAKMNGGFAFYLPTLPLRTGATIALLSAFFDDAEQPLTICTLLLEDDSISDKMLAILKYEEVDIYFFDEQNYEWMSYSTTLTDGGSCLAREKEFHLLSYHPETVKSIYQALTSWFGHRTPEDDSCAIRAVFKRELSPNDVTILDLTPEKNNYLGSAGFRRDTLIRTDPGYFQERDISACLLRAFAPTNVLMNPRRRDTFKEVVDHLVLTESAVILIQAKDSPTTESGITRGIARKRLVTHGQIEDALRQIKGAARYLQSKAILELVVGGESFEVSIGERAVIGLAIVKELFEDEAEAYTVACAQLAGLSGGGMVLDYNAFHTLTHHFKSEHAMLQALEAIILRTRTNGWFPVKGFVLDAILNWIDNFTEDASSNPSQ